MTKTKRQVPGSGIPLLAPGRMSAWYMLKVGPPAIAGVTNHAALVSRHPKRPVYTRDSGVMSA